MENNAEEIVLFDNGEELVEKKLIKRQNGFDGMTGEPVFEYCIQNGFDGMTGEPVYIQVGEVGDDAESGKKIFKKKDEIEVKAEPEKETEEAESTEPSAEQEAGQGAEPATDEESDYAVADEEETSKKGIKDVVTGVLTGKHGIKILAGVAAAVILIVVLAAAAVAGVFIDKHDKLLLAAYNTVKDDTIGGTAVKAGELLKAGDVTVEYDGKIGYMGVSASVDGSIASNISKGQYYADANVNVAGVAEQTAQVYMDGSVIQCAVPEINDKVYEYNYTKTSDGFLAETVEKNTIGSIDDVNAIISSAHNMTKSSAKYNAALLKAFRKEFKKIKLEKVDKKVIEIDGKERKCPGYEFEIDDDNTDSFVDAYAKAIESVYGKDMKDMLAALENLGSKVDEDSYDDSIDTMKDTLQALDGVVVRIYTYKNMLSCVEFEKGKDVLSVEFRGGDTRCSNMRAVMKNGDNKSTLKRKSSVKGSKEEGSITIDGNKAIEYEYDTKSGNFEISVAGQSIDGTLFVSGSEITAGYDGNAFGVEADMNMTVKKGARIGALKGSKVDLGDVDEDDIEEIYEEIQEAIAGSASSMFMNSLGGFGGGYDEWAAPAAEEAAPAEEAW